MANRYSLLTRMMDYSDALYNILDERSLDVFTDATIEYLSNETTEKVAEIFKVVFSERYNELEEREKVIVSTAIFNAPNFGIATEVRKTFLDSISSKFISLTSIVSKSSGTFQAICGRKISCDSTMGNAEGIEQLVLLQTSVKKEDEANNIYSQIIGLKTTRIGGKNNAEYITALKELLTKHHMDVPISLGHSKSIGPWLQ